MKQLVLLDENGNELRRSDVDDDGLTVSHRVMQKASLIGAIRLLEEMARKDDNPHYRRSARLQADALKAFIRRSRGVEVNLSDTEIFGETTKAIEAKRKQLPPTTFITIEMEK